MYAYILTSCFTLRLPTQPSDMGPAVLDGSWAQSCDGPDGTVIDCKNRKSRTCSECKEPPESCPGARSGVKYKGGGKVWCKTKGSRAKEGLSVPS